MAILTEKEITVTGSGAIIDIYAEYSDGKVTDIYALLEIDGNRMGKSPGILVYDGIKESFTSFCMALQMSLNPELSREFYKELNILIKR